MKIQARANCNDYMFTGLVPNEVYEGTPMYDDSKNIYQYDINGIKFHVSHFYPVESSTTPKWVTAKFNTQGGLVKDQDYKVIEESGQWYRVDLGDGYILRVGKHIFYSKEECLLEHKVVEEDESGFDNLVYVEPAKCLYEYSYIPLSGLSEDQKMFLVKNLNVCDIRFKKDFEGEDIIMTQANSTGLWWTNKLGVCDRLSEGDKISFNDIFVEKTNG